MYFLDTYPINKHQCKAYLVTKSPLRDESNQVIRVIFHGIEINNPKTIEIEYVLAKIARQLTYNELKRINSYMLNNEAKKIILTGCQSQVLFFLLRGKTIKQIALLLNLSPRTIDDYLEQLRIKFHVQNKYELINKAIKYNVLHTINESLFNTQ